MGIAENITEDELLERIARGNQEAFQVIFRRHYKALCYFAASITQDAQEAEDLVQETFSKLWDKRADFPTTTAIKAFLYISTKNACLNYIRQKHRQTEKEKEFSYLQEEAPADFDPLMADVEIIGELYAEIEQLPPQCRRVFTMSYLEGRKNEEIAGLLGVSYNTVRTQKLRALKLIRASLLKKDLLPAFILYMALMNMR
ncbi:RNA polymerase sigma-70 factor [Chitinophaga alhagiae]|uniref:RNA polymerase sigma-70 factor n=1 Tax=Chitinophaga alhagiae TaxID=2203219 RepID=A0ABM6WDU9_9BACT|nr:RNA polymerase sigma-70 factor [Chitinophaga alhagiae]AWO02047.1 RNA polymerase sigma-70 factor [Chitinophaga alhagiae]